MSYLPRRMGMGDDLIDQATNAYYNPPATSIPDPNVPTFTPPTTPEVPSNPFQVTQNYTAPPAPQTSSSSGGGSSGGGGAFDFSVIGNKFPGLLSSSTGSLSPIAIGALAVGAVIVYKLATKPKTTRKKNPARRRR